MNLQKSDRYGKPEKTKITANVDELNEVNEEKTTKSCIGCRRSGEITTEYLLFQKEYLNRIHGKMRFEQK